MHSLTAAGVLRHYGDSRFYKTPCLKALLVGVSACSIFYRLLAARATSPRWLLWSVRMWACPSAGVWLVAVLILISCRPLERQLGPAKFTRHLFSSTLGGLALAISFYAGSSYHDNITLPFPTGAIFHVIVGSLAWLYHSTVYPLHTFSLLSILPITSNTILYLLTGLFSCSTPTAGLFTICGLVGAGIQSGLGPLPLPTSPAWLTSWLSLLLDTEGQPPDRLSGATLAVQREQQMDQLEHMMASLQQNRLRVVLEDRLRRRPPSQEQVAQLVGMGFTQNEAQQALVATGNDTAAAIQLLTSRNFPAAL